MAFTPSCSLEAGLMFSQHQRTKIFTTFTDTHPPHVDLGGRGGDDPFHKGAVPQADSVTELNLPSNRVSPSFCHTRTQARTEHRATCGCAFKSSLIPSLLSTCQNDLAHPVFPQTESTRASLVLQINFYTKKALQCLLTSFYNIQDF